LARQLALQHLDAVPTDLKTFSDPVEFDGRVDDFLVVENLQLAVSFNLKLEK